MGALTRKPLFEIPESARNEVGLLDAKYAAYDATVSMHPPDSPEIRTTDAFSNPVARLGLGTQNLMEGTQYPLTRLSQNYNLLNSLYRGNWIVRKIVSTIPEDVTKNWFKVKADIDPDEIEKIYHYQEVINLRGSIVKGMKWGRLYGGAIGLILIKGDSDLLAPLDYRKIMPDAFKGLYIVDRWSGLEPSLELEEDFSDPDFGLPKYYRIRDQYGIEKFVVHHSRVIRFIGNELPYFEQIAEQYWGQSVIESVYQEIVKKDNVSFNIASLTFKANLDVIEMDNIDQLFAIGGVEAQKRFWNLIQAQSVVQSNLGTRIINKGDKFNQYQYAFTGLRDVYETMLLELSGATSIPATRLFGRQPSGLNATGESDLIIYDDYLGEVRTSDFKPIVNKLLPILAISCWGKIPNGLRAEYDAIRTPTENDKATIAQRKVGVLLETFKANGIPKDVLLMELKNLSPLIGMYDNITDEMIEEGRGIYQKDIDALNDVVAGLTMNPFEDNEADPEPVEKVEATING